MLYSRVQVTWGFTITITDAAVQRGSFVLEAAGPVAKLVPLPGANLVGFTCADPLCGTAYAGDSIRTRQFMRWRPLRNMHRLGRDSDDAGDL